MFNPWFPPHLPASPALNLMHILFAQVVEAAKNAPAAVAPVAAPVAEAVQQAAPAVVPAAEPSVVAELLNSGLMKYMLDGGFFMWPILLLGILAAGVILERLRSLRMLNTNVEKLRERVIGLLQEDKVAEAIDVCENEHGPVPAVLSAGLRKLLLVRRLGYDAARTADQVNKAMEDYSVHIVAALERHLPILATVASAAPMIGFLGTVQGMVVSFSDIVNNVSQKSIVEAAAAGIMVSLLTTVLGLVVGIPAFIGFNYFTSVINRFVLDVAESASELLETVTVQSALYREAVPNDATRTTVPEPVAAGEGSA